MREPASFLLENLPLIEHVTHSMCRRRRLAHDEADEFASVVKLRLIENDYAILRRFEERCSVHTYLAAVIGGFLIDFRNHEWGKWRSSAEATRLGELACYLERLLYRERYAPDEAYVRIAQLYPDMTRARFEELRARIPPRITRRHVALAELTNVPQEPDVSVYHRERAAAVSAILTKAMGALPDEDRMVLRLRFFANLTTAQTARALQINPQSLYRRMHGIMAKLREELETAGIDARDVHDLVGTNAAAITFALEAPTEEATDGRAVLTRQGEAHE